MDIILLQDVANLGFRDDVITVKDGYARNYLIPQGKLLPRRITGNSLKYQKKVAVAVKRARHLAILPYVADLLK